MSTPSEEETCPPIQVHRRHTDQRIDSLEDRQVRIEERVATIDKKMDEQTEILSGVRDLLGTFRITAAIAKWISIIGAACAAVLAALHIGPGGGK